MSNAIKIPSFLKLGTDAVTVTLSKPTQANGVEVDALRLRAPTVRDIRAAQATAGGDDEQREMNLFASLAEVGPKDLEGLTLKDYARVQAGYFRLVQDDEL
ncbi:phage tail assembly protein [Pseudomonas sp. JQ170]|uniref:phage tail assembly protein n=1 Tax=unclassified Pseudomonas TaxID=196821 RepID=UPI00264D8B4C|nr:MULTISPECIES: phage tail assembly protein [unclassified Pseudomonas]MDN7142685.1 phage tail assembly protein [Pseudomonas sp. JQ170]WRO77963.1 phage tail assembly protein [Pseudomonas sp. 170C]